MFSGRQDAVMLLGISAESAIQQVSGTDEAGHLTATAEANMLAGVKEIDGQNQTTLSLQKLDENRGSSAEHTLKYSIKKSRE